MTSPRHLAIGLALVCAIVAAFVFWPHASEKSAARRNQEPSTATPLSSGQPRPDRSTPSTSSRPRAGVDSPAAPSPAAAALFNPADFPIAAELNAPGSTISRDLDILQRLFDAWRTNFPREGNPVGENAGITAALAGDNRVGLALVPRQHPAINAHGELCDRWGTPFRFHQLSGERMEVRSAGPDRKFATADDAVWTPPHPVGRNDAALR